MLTSSVLIICGPDPTDPLGKSKGKDLDVENQPYNPDMSDHVQIRIVSLLDEASNSFEQLETLANRFLAEVPHDKVDVVDLRHIERDFMGEDAQHGREMDHVVYIKYRTADVSEE
jgi:hypothetical protein